MTAADDYRAKFSHVVAFGSPAAIISATRQFEDGIVKFMLTRMNIAKYRADAIRENNFNATGVKLLSLACFNEYFTNFPFLLGANLLRRLEVPWSPKITAANYAVHTDPYSTVPSCFKQFNWVPFVVAYVALYDQMAAKSNNRGICLVFPRKGLPRGMCIHNDDSEQYWPSGLAWVYKFTDGGKDRRLFVQPFQSLVEAIYANGRGWKP